jgi:hypothetical protein
MDREDTGRNSTLPEISKPKHVEVASVKSAPPFLEDSGLELRGTGSSLLSRPSTAGSSVGRGWVTKSPSPRFTPSPPPGTKGGGAARRAALNTKKVKLLVRVANL